MKFEPLGRRALTLAVSLSLTIIGFHGEANAHSFGATPEKVVVANANRSATCVNGAKLAAMIFSPTWPETTGTDTSLTPSPMTLSRGDNNNNFYPFGNPNGPYRRAFWHPGVGAWQIDDRGFASASPTDARMSVLAASHYVAEEMNLRWCQSLNLDTVFAPWHACDNGVCKTIFNDLYDAGSATLRHIDPDPKVGNYGGTEDHVCREMRTDPTTYAPYPHYFTCTYVNPSLAQGHTGWTGNPSGTPPLTYPFYVTLFAYEGEDSNGQKYSAVYERRTWLKQDTGYSEHISASRRLGVDSRNGLNWYAGYMDFCDTTTLRGNCYVPNACAQPPCPSSGFMI